MTAAQLAAEKADLKRVLAQYDRMREQLAARGGLDKATKEPVRALYVRYNTVKRLLNDVIADTVACVEPEMPFQFIEAKEKARLSQMEHNMPATLQVPATNHHAHTPHAHTPHAHTPHVPPTQQLQPQQSPHHLHVATHSPNHSDRSATLTDSDTQQRSTETDTDKTAGATSTESSGNTRLVLPDDLESSLEHRDGALRKIRKHVRDDGDTAAASVFLPYWHGTELDVVPEQEPPPPPPPPALAGSRPDNSAKPHVSPPLQMAPLQTAAPGAFLHPLSALPAGEQNGGQNQNDFLRGGSGSTDSSETADLQCMLCSSTYPHTTKFCADCGVPV